MQITDTLNSLHEEFESLAFRKCNFFILVVKQIPIFSILQNHVDIVLINEGIPQFDNVRMVDL